ncbi:MAG: thioredoxin domain-containing protein, partial [Vicinamibacteria bacterium]
MWHTVFVVQERPSKEPFFLSMLPFVGLGLLLVLALVWRYLPGKDAGAATLAEDRGKAVIDMWEQMGTAHLEIAETDFTLGPEDAPVTIVEFSDFQCPYCRTAAEAAKEVLSAHPDDVRLVFKNFPLDTACNEDMQQQLHPLACRSALAALCAGETRVELFWQAHDALFAAPQITERMLAQLPVDLSLPADSFESCLASEESTARVKEDLAQGRKLSITGTPAFFVNGRRAADYRDGALLRLVEHILA